jgi:hypothetical protein
MRMRLGRENRPVAELAESRLPEPRPHSARRLGLLGGGAAVLVVGVGLAIGKAASYARLLHDLRHAHTAWLALCLGGEMAAYTGYLSTCPRSPSSRPCGASAGRAAVTADAWAFSGLPLHSGPRAGRRSSAG